MCYGPWASSKIRAEHGSTGCNRKVTIEEERVEAAPTKISVIGQEWGWVKFGWEPYPRVNW